MRWFMLLLFTATLSLTAADQAGEWVWAKVTGYCPCTLCCGPEAHGVTSRGLHVDRHPYGIAGDPVVFPRGTRIQVPGYLEATAPGQAWLVDDTGGAMREDAAKGVIHIDIRFKTHAAARQWGVRWMWVRVVAPTSVQ